MSDGEPIEIPADAYFLTPEEKALFVDPDSAAYNLFHKQNLLPVGRMFGMDGQIVTNPLHAFSCVAWADTAWVMLECKPGEITPRHKDRPWLR